MMLSELIAPAQPIFFAPVRHMDSSTMNFMGDLGSRDLNRG